MRQKLLKFLVSDVKVSSNGVVQWIVPATAETNCLLNVKLFPFDSQQCAIDFGTLTLVTFRTVN